MDFESSNQGPEEQTIEASFTLLESCLEKLSRLAPVQSAEQILELVPPVTSTTQRLILVELIKFDMACASEADEHRRLDFYWPAVGTQLPQELIPFDLVVEEIQLRKAAGESVEWQEYRHRFPDLAETLGKWLAGEDTDRFSGVTRRVPELPVGSQVDDFFILKELGQGAFARVYLARQESMQRLVALKATMRGSEEPQALSRLDHDNIVRVYDQRQIPDPPTILLYMQYLPGGTLADLIQALRDLPRSDWSGQQALEVIDQNLLAASQSVPEHSPIRRELGGLDWPRLVAWIGNQLAEGLHYANRQGVLHRDVKPANILLSAEAIPKLADFNVSCSGLSGRAGAAAYFGGSLAYMSPEQLQVADPTDPKQAEELDGRSDLFALGMVLWELWQGGRPWSQTDAVSNWTAAVDSQRRLRSKPFAPVHPIENSADRVLEKTLRQLLAPQLEARPQTGGEAAARLQLALHPELANRFEPDPHSLAGRLLAIPTSLLAAIIIFVPNVAASVFNFFYNQDRMLRDFSDVPGLVADFHVLANWVNGIVFPVGAILFCIFVFPVAKIVQQAKREQPANWRDYDTLWSIGNRAASLGGILWTISGLVFATSLASLHPEFDFDDAVHFFVSLILCGGVAWIYPYFGMTWLSLSVYYPKAVAVTMKDEVFERRCTRLLRHNRRYLISAAAIPLTALGALVFREHLPRVLILGGVVVTALGLFAAFIAFQRIDELIRQLAQVLGDSRRRFR